VRDVAPRIVPSAPSPDDRPVRGPGRLLWALPVVVALLAGCVHTPPVPTSDADVATVPDLLAHTYDGDDLAVGAVLEETDAYVRRSLTYRSDGLTISGTVLVPHGSGPFPLVVLNHGYVAPEVYVGGVSMAREADHLVRSGYVVLAPDYRGYGASDPDPVTGLELLRVAYAADVVNAVLAVREADLPYVDEDRVALVGHSMGGGVTLAALVARPDLVDAAVLYAPVSTDAADIHERFYAGEDPDALAERLGVDPDGLWDDLSTREELDRVAEPVLVQHGTADTVCPFAWSEETVAALTAAGADARLVARPGEGHQLEASWLVAVEDTERFLAEHLA
jgi:dipeptidyl aminopeptidase/acylaminoacyl peptidase